MRPMTRRRDGSGLAMVVLGLWGAMLGASEPTPVEPRKPKVPMLQVEKYSLPNGLTVLLHEDHKTPVVAVNLWYRVGSKDEKPGRTGFAHLFEHMMFQGSKHHDSDYFMPLEKLGADLNGTTGEDDTIYYETVPSNALELALWLEADRMGFLLPSMTQERLDNQRDVVKNERRESVDNVPYGQAEEALLKALYPADHPYHHSVIGSMADLSAARLADVSAFFRTYYVPNNAILCVAGDFQPEQAKSWIKKYFGPLPRGPEVVRPKPAIPKLAESKHITIDRRGEHPRAELIWPTVPSNHPDEPALDVLAAVLGGLPKENRLFRTLMYDRQLASQVAASHPTHLLSGMFEVRALRPPWPEARRAGADRPVRDRTAEERRADRGRGPQSPERARERARDGHAVGHAESRALERVHGPARRSPGLPGRDREDLCRHARRREAGGQGLPRPPFHRARRRSGCSGIASARVGRGPRDAGARWRARPSSRFATTSTDRRSPFWDRLPDTRRRASSAAGFRTASSSGSSSGTICRS